MEGKVKTNFEIIDNDDSQCSVALSHSADGWSVMCSCGIFLSYSFAF